MTDFDKIEAYRRMHLIRKVEQAIRDHYGEGKMQTPVHLSIGQEAAAVGVAMALPDGAQMYASHRSHAPYLAMGGDVYKMIAELHGSPDGSTGGMGGSMYLTDPDVGFMGSYAVVGDCVSVAVGAAMAAKHKGEDRVVVAYFGDAVPETGQFWEALNIAATWKLPILFVCENNGYATASPIRERQPPPSWSKGGIWSRTGSYLFSQRVVDRSPKSVWSVAELMVDELPSFLEIRTYRHYGHVGMAEDWDMGYRSLEDEGQYYLDHDPLKTLESELRDELGGDHKLKPVWVEANGIIRRAFAKGGWYDDLR